MEWTLIGKKDPQLPQVRSLNHIGGWDMKGGGLSGDFYDNGI